MSEFTGERVIPGEVNDDLWAEHVARYAFVARYAARKSVLDIGCGAGYGVAALAKCSSGAFGIDIAMDALSYARASYPPLANIRLAQASATALPFRAESFDVVTAFEVIEHLRDWRALLSEARRVMQPDGLFFVSTPNKSYYAESRAKDGPNPFHEHEFEFSDFQSALAEFFPHVSIFLQNWHQSIAFVPALASIENVADSAPLARIESASPLPQEAHFFLAVCSILPPQAPHSFLYVPSAANLLREREQHIHLLETELDQSKRWLSDARSERDEMIAKHATQKQQLEESNRWARKLETDWKTTVKRIAQVQDELRTAQAFAAQRVSELEEENRRKTAWAIETERRFTADLAAKCDELAETVRLLDRAEATVIERTQWAQRVQGQLDDLEAKLQMIRDSRWIRLGRTIGLGPRVDG